MLINGWQVFYYKAFAAALDELEAEVTRLAAKDPKGYKAHPKTRLLASEYEVITQRVPANPEDAQNVAVFHPGNQRADLARTDIHSNYNRLVHTHYSNR